MFLLLCGVWFVCYSTISVVAATEETSVQNTAKNLTEHGRASIILTLIKLAKDLLEDAMKYTVKPSCPVAESQCDKPMDCAEIQERDALSLSGIHKIWPRSRTVNGPVNVYCDMDDDGGGWTVIQRRGDFDSPVDYFYQDWAAYKKGFGDLLKDFWLGNDIIFALTNQRFNKVKFSLGDFESNKTYATYDEFWIDDEFRSYTMHVRGYRGTAGDSFTYHDNAPFSTKDRDNDGNSPKSCASTYKGAWWYKSCYYSNLNGEYLKGPQPKESSAYGLAWQHFRGADYSLKDTIIKIRPKDLKNILTNITPQ